MNIEMRSTWRVELEGQRLAAAASSVLPSVVSRSWLSQPLPFGSSSVTMCENNQAQEDPISQEDEMPSIENIDQLHGEKFLVAQVEIEANSEQRREEADQGNREEEECAMMKKDGTTERKGKKKYKKIKRKTGIQEKNVKQENNQAQEDPISQEDELLNIENIDQLNGDKFLVAEVELEGNTEQRSLRDELNTDQEIGEDEVNTEQECSQEEECARKKKNATVERKVNVSGIKNLNWCLYTLESLIEATNYWKANKSRFFGGPLLFLIVFYVDNVIFKSRRVQRQFPSFVGWNA
ncbi:hypothetical protein DM860_000071 [Cuscuta australis]|uniref:Uncharacterized protein n=1 Tax=Cuscuta australis TaxID=267555 RepID=A0A328CVI8_9ASTE|nr:hypothetical protein DM860_000071 [Cuscuta australis]